MKRLIAVTSAGQTVATRTTHRDYTHAVIYPTRNKVPTWHGRYELALRAHLANPGSIICSVHEEA